MDQTEKLNTFKKILKQHTNRPNNFSQENPVEKILNHIEELKKSRLSSNTMHIVKDIYSIQLRNEKHIEKIEIYLSSFK